MTRHLVPPRPGEQLSNTKGRVHDLERRLARAIPERVGFVAKFSLNGILYESVSGNEVHPTGGRLILVYATLVEAGTSTTVLELRKNGTTFATLKLPAGVAYNELVVSQEFAPRTDTLRVAITSAGVDADTITAYGLFDR